MRASLARAEESGAALVLLIDPGMPALVHRLREEIESLGLEVRTVAAEEPAMPLEARARAAFAIAAIRITRSGEGAVEMTIVDRATGKTVSRRLAIAMPTDPASAELITTRTVELLRASLMELKAPHPPRGDVEPPAEVEALTSVPDDDRGRRGFDPAMAVGAAVVSSRGLEASADVSLGLSVLFRERLGVMAQVFLPVTGSTLATTEGSVQIFSSRYRVGGVFSTALWPRTSARLQAGVVVSRLSLRGSAVSPHSAAQDQLTTWGPWFGAGFGVELTRNFGVWLAADAAVTFPRTVIRSAGREVLDWGRPLAAGAAGLELGWP